MRNRVYLVLLICMSLTAFAIDFTDNHHLLFIFSSHCPHCHNQGPVLKAFAEESHFQVEAYSLDDKGVYDFPDAQTPPDDLLITAYANQSVRTPAIFVVNSETLALYPVAIGEMGLEELRERIRALSVEVITFENGIQQ